MTRNGLILLAVFVLTALAGWAIDKGGPLSAGMEENNSSATPLTQAPDFSFTDINGNVHRLSDFRGKPIVLNFWASWCAPCVVEFPLMLELAQKTKDEAVFIFLSQDMNVEDMNRFVSKLPSMAALDNAYIAHDPNGAIARDLYQSYMLPETYLLSSNLYIAEKIVGADYPWASDDTANKIRLLGQAP
jgi:thiol-disulfide isomerase/thioredoxin